VVVHLTDRLLLVDPTGEIRGIDASARAGNYNFAFPTQTTVTLIEMAPLEAEREGLDMRATGNACIVQELSPKNGLRIEGEPFAFRMPGDSVERALVADGWLLFSSKIALIAIPLPVKTEAPPPTAPGTADARENPPANAAKDAFEKRG